MNAEDAISTLFRHNLWANICLFEVCAKLTDNQLNHQIVGTYGSIRDTLAHIARSEAGYLHRIRTGQPLRRDASAPAPTIDALLTAVRNSGQALVKAAPTVAASDAVTIDWEGTPRMVPCVILLTQAIDHATEHRAQIMATLTQLGIEPPSLDGWTYFADLDR